MVSFDGKQFFVREEALDFGKSVSEHFFLQFSGVAVALSEVSELHHKRRIGDFGLSGSRRKNSLGLAACPHTDIA